MTNILPGKIIELNDRVFKIQKCFYDDDGMLESVRAECITPKDGDSSEWFSLEIYDESLVDAYTLH